MSWEGDAYLSVDELRRHYETTHSTPLNPCEYGFMTLTELLKSLPYLVEVRVCEGFRPSYWKLLHLALLESC